MSDHLGYFREAQLAWLPELCSTLEVSYQGLGVRVSELIFFLTKQFPAERDGLEFGDVNQPQHEKVDGGDIDGQASKPVAGSSSLSDRAVEDRLA